MEEKKYDLEIAYIITFLDNSCKALDRKVHSSDAAWMTRRETFKSVSEASIDSV